MNDRYEKNEEDYDVIPEGPGNAEEQDPNVVVVGPGLLLIPLMLLVIAGGYYTGRWWRGRNAPPPAAAVSTPAADSPASRFVITIDPKTARDFDDAISVTRDEHGWRLGIHIADVAHFVRENGPIDLEARRRGNSMARMLVQNRELLPERPPEQLVDWLCDQIEHELRDARLGLPEHEKRKMTAFRVAALSALVNPAADGP